MAAPLTPVGIANRALAKIGAGAIQSFDQTLPPGPQVALVYDVLMGELLAKFPWSFTLAPALALAQVAPDQTDGATYDNEGWQYCYALPANLLQPPDAYLTNPRRADWPMRDFDVQGQLLYCDEPAVWARCRFYPDESIWPPYFVAAAVHCLAAELIMPISGNAGQRDKLLAEAFGTPEDMRRGGMIYQAALIDSQNDGEPVLRANPLIDARYA